MEGIKCLSGSVHSSLRASVFLFDIARIVDELILNSLDAGATKVDVGVDVEACYLKVEDNGFGFTREGLTIVGERYATSKISKSFGIDDITGGLSSRGETLSSLSDISLLEVVTRARGRPNAYRKVMKGQKCLFLGIEDSRQNVGTTVIVRELFYNQPVRRRSMQASPKKVILSVKKCMLHTALVHPTISFKLTDLQCESEMFLTVPSSSPMPLVSCYFGTDISSCLHEVNYFDKKMKLNGFLSVPHGAGFMKAFQYLYINSRLVCRGPVHKLIKSLSLGLSSSLKYSNVPEFRDMKRQRMEDCPAYLLNLQCPLSSYDLTFEPSKTVVEFKDWAFVLSFIEQAVWNSWKQSPEQLFLGNAKKQECGPFLGDETDDRDVLATSANLDRKGNVPSHGSANKAISDINFLKTETDYCYHSSFSNKRKNAKSIFLMDEIDFPKDDKLKMWITETEVFDISPERWNQEDKGKRPQLNFLKPTSNFNENKRDMWSVPFLTQCGQSLDMYTNHGNDLLSPEDQPEVIEDFSDQVDDKFHKGDTFTVSFDLMGGDGMEKKRIETLSQNYYDMKNTETIRGSRGYGLPVSFDDLDWCVGSRDSKYFDSKFKKKQASSTLEFDDDALWFNPKQLKSRNGIISKYGSYSKLAEESKNLVSSHLKDPRRRRSRSAPPFNEFKRKISFRLLSDVCDGKNLDARFSKGAADLLGNVSQPCGTTQLVTKSTTNDTILNKQSGPESDDTKFCQTPVEDADELALLDSNSSKWRTRDLPANSSVQDIRDQKRPIYDDILNVSSGILQVTGNSLVPESVCRETLQDAKVLQQLDQKFIPATAGSVLIVIDQHAADERIRLEELRKKVLSGEGCSITYLDSEHELALPEMGLQLVHNYEEQIRKWGWICNSNARCSGSLSRNLSLVKQKSCSITIVAVPCVLGIDLSEKDLMEYLEQLADTDGASSMPPSVLRILNFKACRGAIMFGDPLLPSECSLIVDELKETSLCFQCAHGRPTTAPLTDLAELHRQLAKLRLQAGGQITTWHGLKQHMPSTEWARARLISSKRLVNAIRQGSIDQNQPC